MYKLLLQLPDDFALKDLGPLHYFEVISYPSGGLVLHASMPPNLFTTLVSKILSLIPPPMITWEKLARRVGFFIF